MNEQKKDKVNLIIDIIARTNPTFQEAYALLEKVEGMVKAQIYYIGIGPTSNDSKKAEEIFSIFADNKTEIDDALNVISAAYEKLRSLSSQSRLSIR